MRQGEPGFYLKVQRNRSPMKPESTCNPMRSPSKPASMAVIGLDALAIITVNPPRSIFYSNPKSLRGSLAMMPMGMGAILLKKAGDFKLHRFDTRLTW